MKEKLSPKLIIDICIDQNIMAREAIKIISETLAHMLKFSSGHIDDRLKVMDSICESIKNSMKEMNDGME